MKYFANLYELSSYNLVCNVKCLLIISTYSSILGKFVSIIKRLLINIAPNNFQNKSN